MAEKTEKQKTEEDTIIIGNKPEYIFDSKTNPSARFKQGRCHSHR